MSRKATINNLFVQRGEASASTSASTLPGRVKTGAIGAMGSSLRQLTETAKAASRLQEQLAAGSFVAEIEPDKIDVSPVADRIVTEVDPGFDELVESFKTSGQQVPILVRPHGKGRYQIAYGHRRARVAAKLGIKVKALVRELTDAELVVAQGKENLDRKDLSYIERAQFARGLEAQGFERPVIMAALSTDKTDLSRYLSVANAIPGKIVQAIGPAPRTGRPRWVALSEKIEADPSIADAVIAGSEFKALDSDARFVAVFNAFAAPAPKSISWACEKAAKIDQKPDRTVLTIDERRAPEFGAWLAGRLDELYREFQRKEEQAD